MERNEKGKEMKGNSQRDMLQSGAFIHNDTNEYPPVAVQGRSHSACLDRDHSTARCPSTCDQQRARR